MIGVRGRFVAVLVAVTAFGVLAVNGSAAENNSPAPQAPVQPQVADAIAADGESDFWVMFGDRADLSGADEIGDWEDRGQYVYDRLTATAKKSQADLLAELRSSRVDHQSFWISNQVLVRGGDQATLDLARSDPEVRKIRATRTYELPEPIKGSDRAHVDAVEWGIANINADDVWSTFGVRGEGIVVGNIDTGVDFDHPALVNEYRGSLGGGSFDHNYNWFDPSSICGSPAPCDNNNHGSHTMGTMVGDDGGANQIGVAPGAEWIAAKGCESSSCSDAALLASGQWMLAPTSLAGTNPRPDLRPNVINNSWGGDNGSAVDGWYRATLTAWQAAGQFGTFSNGNAGPACDTTGSPADNLESFSVGAYDINNAIAAFSSRGPGESGALRPSISAPGVDIRSSINGGSYGLSNGTSMAAPHLSGAVALMWSAAPTLVGDIPQTRQILEQTAIDTSNLTCGGTAADNNVFGEGRLDALAAVTASPIGANGDVAGFVRDDGTNDGIGGATVSTTIGANPRSTTTVHTGHYGINNLPVGTYNVTAAAFGYATKTRPVTITDGTTANLPFRLIPRPTHAVSGTVRAGGPPVQGAKVAIAGAPIAPVTTDAAGHYSFPAVPRGSYTFEVSYAGCATPASVARNVNGPETFNFALSPRLDTYGHRCDLQPTDWVAGSTLVLSGDDASAAVALPFSFSHYGTNYATANVSTNGHLSFAAASTVFTNTAIPNAAAPNAAVYPQWDDLHIDASGAGVYTATKGAAPNRKFVIEWENVHPYSGTERWDFEAILYESGGSCSSTAGSTPTATGATRPPSGSRTPPGRTRCSSP